MSGSLFLAWTAAFLVYGCLAAIVMLLGMLVLVRTTTGRTRAVLALIVALLGFALAMLLV